MPQPISPHKSIRNDFLPFSKPCISEDEISAVAEVLRSGWITTGRKAADFEENFSAYLNGTGAVALSSASAGMHLALKAFGIGPGDEVITPSMTWVSTPNLIVLAGAKPVFVDIERDTLMITSEAVRSQITDRTRLIIPVHFAGAPVDLDAFRKLSQDTGIPLIEDAAHALGTYFNGEKIGRTGTSIFSFHPIKNITTGEGGMFCSDDPDLLAHIRRLKFHGLGADAYDRQSQGRAPLAQVLEPGFKYNLTDIAAVLGSGQLKNLETFNSKRAALAMRYRELLAGIDEIIPLADPDYDVKHAWHLFIVRVDTQKSGLTREAFMDALKAKNVGTGIHFLAVHLHKYYREVMQFKRGTLPHTEWNSDRIVSLPLFPTMHPEDVDGVVTAIKEVLARG